MEKIAMKRSEVTSSNIKSVGYSPIRRKLEVEFKSGDVYRYKGVPNSVYKNFMSSDSKGKYLNKDIKYNYPYRKHSDRNGDTVKGSWQRLERKEKQAFIDHVESMEKLAKGMNLHVYLSK